MSHTLAFYAHVQDDAVITSVHGYVEFRPDNDPLLERTVIDNIWSEICWTDGVDLSISARFAKLLSRFMEATGLEPFSF